jgi:4-hydroxyphenylpyruvate dioxygenase
MRDLGFVPLPIPANYYGDLEARFGLSEGVTKGLQSASILYDRDEQGEFFQFYSRTFAEGFFFEAVQRNGYRGYGAVNAPFRIAAQKREIEGRIRS